MLLDRRSPKKRAINAEQAAERQAHLHQPKNSTILYVLDPARLAALDALSILGTAPEEGFDDVVQIARVIWEAPAALARRWSASLPPTGNGSRPVRV
jgi:hypothetical protein